MMRSRRWSKSRFPTGRLKYVNGHLVSHDTPCPIDCWHERNGYTHVVYRWFYAPGTGWNPRCWPESLGEKAGWLPVEKPAES